jgi:flagellar hook-basal body complex protein FliE
MDISSINSSISPILQNQVDKTEKTSSGPNFKDMLKNAMTEVNNTQVDGYNAMEGIATGKVKNLQEAVQKIEEAELTMKLALEVKNKAISAFKEVSKMQI